MVSRAIGGMWNVNKRLRWSINRIGLDWGLQKRI